MSMAAATPVRLRGDEYPERGRQPAEQARQTKQGQTYRENSPSAVPVSKTAAQHQSGGKTD